MYVLVMYMYYTPVVTVFAFFLQRVLGTVRNEAYGLNVFSCEELGGKEDTKTEDMKNEDTKIEDLKKEDTKIEDLKKEDAKIDLKKEDTKIDLKKEDTEIDLKKEDTKIEDLKVDDKVSTKIHVNVTKTEEQEDK